MLDRKTYMKEWYQKNKEAKRLEGIWRGMLRRCLDDEHASFEFYGGRGIKVHIPWQNSFEQFKTDMGEPPTPQHTLDRINPDGDYCPENCRWATWEEQVLNRRSSRWLEFNGQRLTVTQWAKKLGVSRSTLYARLNKYGLSVERTLCQQTH